MTVARFSPNGNYVASGDESGIIKVWSCVGEQIVKGEYHIVAGPVRDVAWDMDSARIIAVGEGRNAYGRCLTYDTGNSCGEVFGHHRALNTVSIRQKRPMRAATSGDDFSISFYHGVPFKHNKSLREHQNFVHGVAFSPDAAQLVSVGGDKNIFLCDGVTGDLKMKIEDGTGHTGTIYGVSWAPDSRKFATASADKTVKVWDAETGKILQDWKIGDAVSHQQVGLVWPPNRSDGLIISISLSGDFNYLVEGKEKPIQVITGHQKAINELHLSEYGDTPTLWSASWDGRINHWDISTRTALEPIGQGQTGRINGMTSTSEGKGKVYAVIIDQSLRSINIPEIQYTDSTIHLSELELPTAAVTAGEKTVLVANASRVEFLVEGENTGSFTPEKPITAIAASKNNLVALGHGDSTIHIYEVQENSLVSKRSFRVSASAITSLAFSNDCTKLAAGDSSGQVHPFDPTSGAVLAEMWFGHSARIITLAWHPDNIHLASGSLDTNIYIWSLNQKKTKLRCPNAHQDYINSLVWLPESKLASAGGDGAIKVWEFEKLP